MKKGDLKSGPILSFQQWLNLKLNHRPRHLDSEDAEKMLVLGKLVIPTSSVCTHRVPEFRRQRS